MNAPSEAELLARARAMGGRTLGELAREQGRPLPDDPTRAKGRAGTLVERALGIDAGSRRGPDVPSLGIEIKTLPVDRQGVPMETTFVCCASTTPEPSWETSSARAKLRRVLWVPVEAEGPLASRRLGSAFVWEPPPALEATLRDDWLVLTEMLAVSPEHVSARHGRAMQLRPKGANAAARRRAADTDGAPVWILPRAFYLRRWVSESALALAGFALRDQSSAVHDVRRNR